MKLIIGIMVLLVAAAVGAQTANVLELKPEDSAKVKQAWDDLQKAQAKWKDVNDQIDFKYVEIPYENSLVPAPSYHPRNGFGNGFEFSTDFKYIVPKPALNHYDGSSVVLTPAVQPHCLNTGVCW